MKKLFFILFFVIPFFSTGQHPWTIRGEIRSLSLVKIALSSFWGEKPFLVDSALSDNSGNVSFTMKARAIPGLYRLSWGKDRFLDLVWNREDVVFSTVAESPADSMKIFSSIENRLYYYYLRLDRMNQAKLEVLMPVIAYYPQKNQFYSEVADEYENTQKSQEKIFDSISRLYPESYSVRIFRNLQTPFLPAALSKDVRLNYLKQHFFDRTDFHDTLLLHSNSWANKAVAYLSLYSSNKLNQKQLQAEFIKAVTAMLSAASVNPDIYKFLLDYFVGGFDKYHFDEVVTYIADNFQDPYSCEDQARKTVLQKKLENFKKISVGKIAPEIEIADAKEKTIRLSTITSEYTLVIFWSSECGHCTEMMPKVKKLYDDQKPKRFEVLAVSVDTSKTEWISFLKEEKLDWLNGSDLKGFDGKAADDYNIYATPTMFLLDKGKKILAKPITYRELEQDLREQDLIKD